MIAHFTRAVAALADLDTVGALKAALSSGV